MPDPSFTFLAAAAIMALGGAFAARDRRRRLRRRGSRARARLARFLRRLRRPHARLLRAGHAANVRALLLPRRTEGRQSVGRHGALCVLRRSSARSRRASISACSPIACRARSSPRSRAPAWRVATIGFALAPELKWMLPFAVLFGIGFGGVISSGWALAMDAIPEAARRRARPRPLGHCDALAQRRRAADRRLADRALSRNARRLSGRLRARGL